MSLIDHRPHATLAIGRQAGLPNSDPQMRIQQAHNRNQRLPIIADHALLLHQRAEHHNTKEPQPAHRPARERVQVRLVEPEPYQLLRPVRLSSIPIVTTTTSTRTSSRWKVTWPTCLDRFWIRRCISYKKKGGTSWGMRRPSPSPTNPRIRWSSRISAPQMGPLLCWLSICWRRFGRKRRRKGWMEVEGWRVEE